MAKKQAVSPTASGGAGTIFEYRVAAVILGHLLCGSHPPGLQVPVVRVGLQQRIRGHLLDDIVVYGEPGSVCTEFQVKLTLTPAPGDAAFLDVVTQALHALEDRRKEVLSGELALGLIARGDADSVDQLDELTRLARGHSSHKTFAALFVKRVTAEKYRSRLAHVQNAVGKAINAGAPSPAGGVEQTTHMFLASLQVWRPAAEDDGADYRASLDRLQPVADEFGVSSGTLFAHLAALAEGWGPVAGELDADSVRRRLRRRGLRAVSAGPAIAGSTQKIDVDAVVRGPVEALGMEDDVVRAESLLAEGDEGAIDAYAAIADKLRAAQFFPYATVMLRKRADALQAVGRFDDAVIARVELAWEELDRVQPWVAGFAMHDGREGGTEAGLGSEALRVQAVADAAVHVGKGDDLDHLVGVFDALTGADRFVARAAVFLSEEALAAGMPEIVVDRLARLQNIAHAEATSPDVRRRE